SELEPDLRPWHPHITIARCRDVAPQSLRNFLKSNVDLDAGMIRVDSFHLYSSKLTPAGPIHTRELSVGCREERDAHGAPLQIPAGERRSDVHKRQPLGSHAAACSYSRV